MKLKIIITALLICSIAQAETISEQIIRTDRSLSRVRSMIQAEQNTMRKLSDEKVKAARKLKKAEMELKYNQNLIKKIEKKLFRMEQDINSINFQQQKLNDRQEELKDNIRSANFYIAGAGETELLEALILSDNLTELTAGLQIISRVNSRLFESAQELFANSAQLEANKTRLQAKENELTMALAEQKKTIKDYEDNKILVKQLYRMASEDEKIKTEYVKLLEEKQQEFENRIKQLETAQKKQGEMHKFNGLHLNFVQKKGWLNWPVSGKVIEEFGRKKVEGFRGVIHKKGIKIVPNETQVASVYDGVVMHTDTAWGLGWFVIVEHYGGYYTLYANLDEITVSKDQKVHTGEVLGTIDVDRDENTPYLYFEIRIHDKAVDPLIWLTS